MNANRLQSCDQPESIRDNTMTPQFAHHVIPLLSSPGAAGVIGGKAHLAAVKAACKSAERINGALLMAGRVETALIPEEPDFFEAASGLGKARILAWEVIRQTRSIQWIILTQKPENIAKLLPGDWIGKGYSNVCIGITADGGANLSEKLSALRDAPTRHRMFLITPSSPSIFSHLP